MNEFRRLAAKIEQHMLQQRRPGRQRTTCHHQPHDGIRADLHKIWVGTSDQQLMALSHEFTGFCRFALIME